MDHLDQVISEANIIVTEATNNVIKLPMIVDPILLTVDIENYTSMLPSIEKAIMEEKFVIIISPRIKDLLTDFEYKLFLYVECLVAIAVAYKRRESAEVNANKRLHYAALDIVIKQGYSRFYISALNKILTHGTLEASFTERETFYLMKFIQALKSVSKHHPKIPNILNLVSNICS